MRYIMLGLLILSLPSWAGVPDIIKQSEQTPFEQIVADTFTFEEFAEWTAIRQKFQAKQTKENERQLSCVEQGGHPKQCVDPNWCLYPTNFDLDQCVWYKIKHGY